MRLSDVSSKPAAGSVVQRRVSRLSGRQFRALVKVRSTTTARGKWRAEGLVQRCDGKGTQRIPLNGSAASSSTKSGKATATRGKKGVAVKAAKKAAKTKATKKGARAASDALQRAARAEANRQLIEKIGVIGEPPAAGPPDINALEAKVFELVNQARAENMGTWNGEPVALEQLKYLPQIVPAARAWADELIHGPFEHDPNVEAQGAAVGCNKRPGYPSFWNEAILRADYSFETSVRPTVENFARGVVNAWLNSPSHRAILLSTQTTYAGVGTVYRDKIWTVVFRNSTLDCSNITGY